jgi:cold shock CspA family protein
MKVQYDRDTSPFNSKKVKAFIILFINLKLRVNGDEDFFVQLRDIDEEETKEKY